MVGYQSAGYSSANYNAWNGAYIGSSTSSFTSAVVNYERYFSVTAFDKSGSTPIWAVNVGSSGGSGNYRDVYPYLVLAASDWFGHANARTVQRRYKIGAADALLFDGPAPARPGPWEKPE